MVKRQNELPLKIRSRLRDGHSCPAWPMCGCGTQSGPHTCEFAAECRRRYEEAGIDWRNSNPDGSDYHIMNAIDADVTREWIEAFRPPARG